MKLSDNEISEWFASLLFSHKWWSLFNKKDKQIIKVIKELIKTREEKNEN